MPRCVRGGGNFSGIMGKYYDMLMEDVRMREGMKACMNCGVCTAVCPSAEFYNYDPRQIVSTVQTQDDEAIEALLRSETIWYCGECMSCRPRCPRGNTPGYVVQALRTLSQKLGFFTESEKGRQQFALKRLIGENILNTGYCITPRLPTCTRSRDLYGVGSTTTTGRCSSVSTPPTCRRGRVPCGVSTTGRWRSCTAFSK